MLFWRVVGSYPATSPKKILEVYSSHEITYSFSVLLLLILLKLFLSILVLVNSLRTSRTNFQYYLCFHLYHLEYRSRIGSKMETPMVVKNAKVDRKKNKKGSRSFEVVKSHKIDRKVS